MKTFYKKNNKIITNNDNKLVLCNKCPCKEKSDQYYAIIGFRYKSTNVDSTGSLYNNTSPDNPNLSSVIFSGQIDLQFGKTYKDLPLITDIPLPQIIERPTCTDEYCDNCEGNLIITPFAVENINEIIHPNGWIKHEGIYFELTAKQYIFNDL